MSSAIRKEEESPIDPHQTETGQIILVERATASIAAYIGYVTNQITEERKQTSPNAEKLKALEAQRRILEQELHDLTPDDKELISKSLYIYAPILKAFYSS